MAARLVKDVRIFKSPVQPPSGSNDLFGNYVTRSRPEEAHYYESAELAVR